MREQEIKSPYIFHKYKFSKRVSYNKSYWLFDKKYFFKYLPNRREWNDTGMIVGEMYVSELCKKIGVPCVNTYYAINKHKNFEHRGVLVESFLQKGQKGITISDIRLQDIYKKLPKEMPFQMKLIYARLAPTEMFFGMPNTNKMANTLLYPPQNKMYRLLPVDKAYLKKHQKELEYFEKATQNEPFITTDCYVDVISKYAKEHGYKINGNIRLELQKMAIVDALTKQFDRHDGNISLIVDEKQKQVSLAPMYDNGLCGYFSIDAPLLRYPQHTNCYLKLTDTDMKDLCNKNSEISKFFKNAKEFYKEGFDDLIKKVKKEFLVEEIKRDRTLTEKYGKLREKGKDEYYWEAAKTNFKDGITFIEKQKTEFLEKGLEKV